MGEHLPRLRSTLDVVPSPFPEQPGVVLRDPFGYSQDILLIPQPLLLTLACLDGQHTELDAQVLLTRQGGGELVFGDDIRRFVSLLDAKGFLETDVFFGLRDRRHAEFGMASVRGAAHAGSAYPESSQELRDRLDARFREAEASGPGEQGEIPDDRSLLALAAPHVSPEGGWDSYTAAFRRIDPSLADRTFVILGTSHYGEPEKFGLTRKAFSTPLGTAETDQEMVGALARAAPRSVVVEDYCHAVEHSIEFQVVFLQHRVAAPVRILPILCGPFADSLESGNPPESHPGVGEFFEALTELADRHGERLFWLLGVDLSHIGTRYGDRIGVQAGQGPMSEITVRDAERLETLCAGDRGRLFDLVRPGGDELKWCGFSPFYTFLASLSPLTEIRGRVLKYQQWNIDPQSVVSFAALEFFERA